MQIMTGPKQEGWLFAPVTRRTVFLKLVTRTKWTELKSYINSKFRDLVDPFMTAKLHDIVQLLVSE